MGLRTFIYKQTGIKLKKGTEKRAMQAENIATKRIGEIFFLASQNERIWFERFLREYDTLNKKTAYLNLIRGLDKASVTTVAKTLSRLNMVMNKVEPLSFFSEEEEKEIRDMRKNFPSKIIRLGNECVAYEEILMKWDAFSPHLFYYDLEIRHFDKLERFSHSNIIDAGACFGDSTLVLAKYTDKKVYAFEPIEENYRLMHENIKLNESTKIIPEKYGLGERAEEVEFYVAGGSSSIGIEPSWGDYKVEKAQIIQLDEYVDKNRVKDIGLIKVDVEGAEQAFLRGAKKTIFDHRPSLIISIYHNAFDFFQIKPLIESWDLGYKFKIVKPNDGRLLMETVLLAEIKE